MDSPQQIQARQTAYIVNIHDILKGNFVKEDGWNPNYVLIADKKVSRVNIIGTLVGVSDQGTAQSMKLDDGTGTINIRNFEKKIEASVGDIVLCIGRVRKYGEEIYLTPDFIRKNVNVLWSAVWKKMAIVGTETDVPLRNIEIMPETTEAPIENHVEKILAKIKEMDDGSGAPYEEILEKVTDEKTLANLLLQGEIFEIRPGRLKVLE